MNEEIKKIKDLFMNKMKKYQKSLKFLDENHFLKNMSEYKDFKLFADEIKKRINYEENNLKHVNKVSSSNLGNNSIIKPNQIYYYNYKRDNVSLKD